jgi:hypothetical protein
MKRCSKKVEADGSISHRLRGETRGWWVLIERNAMNWHAATYSAFLAGVRNYSAIVPISEPRGIPPDVSAEVNADFVEEDTHAVAPSWLSIVELFAFDYDREIEDRRVSRRSPQGWVDGAVTAEPGQGLMTTYREFLGLGYFEELARLKRLGAERVVFWFSV